MTIQPQTANHGEHYARGPFYGDKTMNQSPVTHHIRYDSLHDTDYAKQYNMPIGEVFHGNNGPQGIK
jgi:hypothetical protein